MYYLHIQLIGRHFSASMIRFFWGAWEKFFGLGLLCLFISCQPTDTSTSTTAEEIIPPNVLLIISDDQAWTDYGFMGHEQIETPHLDALAQHSLTFTRSYVAAPLCSPSLATMMTGLYPHQHGITGNDPTFEFEGKRYSKEWRMERKRWFDQLKHRFYEHRLLTEYVEQLNYLSLQTGKWWLGSWQEAHFTHGMTHGDPERGGRHGDDGLTIGREGLAPIYDFIAEAQTEARPFFIWYAPFLPHAPHNPPDSLAQKYLQKAPTPAIANYWAMCEWFDQTCGALIDHLEEQGLSDHTLVIYVCDNGWIQQPDQPNRYASRSKRTPYEGGIRTPMMFQWPGKITPRIDTTTLVSSIDIVPSVLAACGIETEEVLPGVNVLDEELLANREAVFAEAFLHDIPSVDTPTLGLTHRIGIDYPWKLIWPEERNVPDGEMELYHIGQDPLEQDNMAKEEGEKVEELKEKVEKWWSGE